MKRASSIENLERHAVILLTYRGPLTCTELGEALWSSGKQASEPSAPSTHPQSYARPAGRILQRLKRKGAVRELPGSPSRWQSVTAANRGVND